MMMPDPLVSAAWVQALARAARTGPQSPRQLPCFLLEAQVGRKSIVISRTMGSHPTFAAAAAHMIITAMIARRTPAAASTHQGRVMPRAAGKEEERKEAKATARANLALGQRAWMTKRRQI